MLRTADVTQSIARGLFSLGLSKEGALLLTGSRDGTSELSAATTLSLALEHARRSRPNDALKTINEAAHSHDSWETALCERLILCDMGSYEAARRKVGTHKGAGSAYRMRVASKYAEIAEICRNFGDDEEALFLEKRANLFNQVPAADSSPELAETNQDRLSKGRHSHNTKGYQWLKSGLQHMIQNKTKDALVCWEKAEEFPETKEISAALSRIAISNPSTANP